MSVESFRDINLLFSLFNPYFIGESRSNVSLYSDYLKRLMYYDNSFEQRMCKLLKESDKNPVTEHVIFNYFPEMNEREKANIFDKINYFKVLSPDDILQYRTTFRDLCESEIINKSNDVPDNQRLAVIRSIEYKSEFSSRIVVENFATAFDGEIEELASPSGIKSSLDFINNASPLGQYINAQVINVTAAPGSGKTLLLMMESAMACGPCNKRVHYLAAGDLNKSDFLLRMAAQINKIPLEEVYDNIMVYKDKTIQYLNGNFSFSCVPAGSINALEYYDFMVSIAEDYDMFVLDYDANIDTESDNMYKAGEELYNSLSKLSKYKSRVTPGKEGKLVFVASQPKIGYWTNDKIPITGLNESSRKQAILDEIITIGKNPTSSTHCGFVSIVKNRRGKKDIYQPYILSNSGVITPVDTNKYMLLFNSKAAINTSYESIISGIIDYNEEPKLELNAGTPPLQLTMPEPSKILMPTVNPLDHTLDEVLGTL